MQIGEASSLFDTKRLVAKVVEVVFDSDVKTAHNRAAISPPHWKEGEDFYGSNSFSERAAVILHKDAAGADATKEVTVKVEVTINENVSGTAVLTGGIDDLDIVGDAEVPTSVGVHTVKAKIQELPDSVRWYNDNIDWGLEVADMGQCLGLNTTRVEVFAVLQRPVQVFASAPGVWSEALRFLCTKAGVLDAEKPEEALEAITSYCHASHGFVYDHLSGAPHYGGFGPAFHLNAYINNQGGPLVNCYDQAAAVQVFSAALGIDATWEYLQPFGFIPTVSLVGTMCNNPFYKIPGLDQIHKHLDKPVVPAKSRAYLKRTDFNNHAFAKFNGGIYDACAGPGLGDSPTDYLDASIDTKSHEKLEKKLRRKASAKRRKSGVPFSKPGTVADISTRNPIGSVF